MQVKLISITPEPEKIISYIARVSNPSNQDNPDYAKLIGYLIRHSHYSPFEHAFMTVEIKTSRAISAQIIRHRSFTFQEYSQRYSEVVDFEPMEIRKQATKNRQSSAEVFDPYIENDKGNADAPALDIIDAYLTRGQFIYNDLLKAGVAKEVARLILPMASSTTIYMTGSCRSWLTYLNLRLDEHTQKEHRMIAEAIAKIFSEQFPIVTQAVNNFNDYKGMFI